MPDLLYDVADGVAKLTLNRPDSLNAINGSLHRQLLDAFARAGADPGVRVVVLRGAGRAFSAGGDLKAVAAGEDMGDPMDLATALLELRKPVVAVAHGYCLGQAFELVQCCDLVIAVAGSEFGEVEVEHGWSPPIPITPQRLASRHAMEVLLLGQRFGAERAERMGLVNWVVAEADLDGLLTAVTDRLAFLEPAVLANNKALVNAAANLRSMASAGTLSPADRQEIEDLLSAYCLALDVDDVEGALELFTEDAEFTTYGRVFDLRRIRRMFETAPKGMHLTGRSLIRPSPEGATVRSHLVFYPADRGAHRLAIYDDVIVRADGRWRFRSRDVRFMAADGELLDHA
jgi:enoyl-CoA hydratase/carnithine racemase